MLSQKIIIEAGKPNNQYWKDVWHFRGLFTLLAWRDILVRYKQTVLGIAWALLRPLLTILAFVFVRWMLAGSTRDENGLPLALVISAATLAWSFFSSAVGEISNSLLSNTNLISKVYFPRIIIPFSATVVCFIDFLVSLVIIVGLMIFYQYVPGIQVLYLPLFFLLAVLCALGIGLFFAAFNVRFRDFRFIVPFIVQFGMYISPVIFSTKEFMAIPFPAGLEWIKTVYVFNPMVGVIDGFRWCFFGGNFDFNMFNFSVSLGVCIFFLIVGFYSFRKLEKEFADVL